MDARRSPQYSVDRFRLRVWNSSNTLVYDNDVGNEPQGNEDGTALTQGSIVIHKKK